MPPRSSDREEKDLQSAASAVVEEAATVVEDAAHVVESAAALVHEAAAVAAAWPAVERRGKPRLLRRVHEDRKVAWEDTAGFGPVLLLGVIICAFPHWRFSSKQY